MKQINQGVLETLHTLTHPSIEQYGMNALKILVDKAIGTDTNDNFIRKLFTVWAYDYVIYDKENMISQILKDFPRERSLIILDSDKDYSIGFSKGFYQWVILIGETNKINTNTWLNEKFQITQEQAQKILGADSYLNNLYMYFNNYLCLSIGLLDATCSDYVTAQQFNDTSITKKILNINNIRELNFKIDPLLYPYEMSPEFIYFYQKVYQKKDPVDPIEVNPEYKALTLNQEQINRVFFNKQTNLLETQNMVKFVLTSSTKDLYSAYSSLRLISKEQLEFLFKYIQYLDENLNRVKIDNKVNVSYKASGIINLLPVLMSNSYNNLLKIKNILISKLVINDIQNDKATCQEILLSSVQSQAIADKICQIKELNFQSYESVKLWVNPFECIGKDCKIEEKLNIIKLTSSLVDLNLFYKPDSVFMKLITQAINVIQDTYGVSDVSSLAKEQLMSSKITLNPPASLKDLKKVNSIIFWDNEDIYPEELKFYQESQGCSQIDCNEQNSFILLSFINIQNDPTSSKYITSYYNRLLMTKAYSGYLYYSKTKESPSKELLDIYRKLMIQDPSPYFNVLESFLATRLFQQEMFTDYNPLLIILGNSIEDKASLNVLSGGSFYDNFRPNIESTTGFSLKTNLHDVDTISNNYYTMKTGFFQREENKRRISNINGYKIFNTNKKFYSPKSNSYFDTSVRLFDNKRLFNMSDGFQYNLNSDNGKEIYFYDSLSSRPLEFTYMGKRDYKEHVSCENYLLNMKNITQGMDQSKYGDMAILDEKFNKPYFLTNYNFLNSDTYKNFSKLEIEEKISKQMIMSYICVDKFSEMVVQSNITLLVKF